MRRSGSLLVAIAGLSLAAAGCGDAAPLAAPPAEGPPAFKVMTQNLYLGGDLDLALAAGADLPRVVEEIWASVQATDFHERAKVIAAGIEAADPDVVGLQEVSLWRTQTPGDHLPIPDATTVAFDFLDILTGELAARGLSYRVVGTVQNGDIELAGASGTDYRLTDRDALLAKTTLPITSAGSGTYPHLATVQLPSPTGGAPLQASIARGWVSAELRAGGETIRLFVTHLEAFSADVAAQQASDLVGMARATGEPTIILGDMNLPPGSAGYETFVAAGTGLRDAWDVVNPADPGLTCCWNPDLRGGAYATRIDLVFATDAVRPTSAVKVDDTERTPGGLAPSDHAGVVVGFSTAASAPAPSAIASAR